MSRCADGETRQIVFVVSTKMSFKRCTCQKWLELLKTGKCRVRCHFADELVDWANSLKYRFWAQKVFTLPFDDVPNQGPRSSAA